MEKLTPNIVKDTGKSFKKVVKSVVCLRSVHPRVTLVGQPSFEYHSVDTRGGSYMSDRHWTAGGHRPAL